MVSGGVFYGQCMQTMFEEAIATGCEVGITVDFDSVFTYQHVQQLLSVLITYENIDALTTIQRGRGRETPLMTSGSKTELSSNGEPVQISTGHFGLTAIKFDRLKDVPKPWFWSQPNEKGEWGEGKIDDDIWFWRQWEKAGRTLYVDPFNTIGHLEEVISEFLEVDGQYKPVHTYPKDWQKRNVDVD